MAWGKSEERATRLVLMLFFNMNTSLPGIFHYKYKSHGLMGLSIFDNPHTGNIYKDGIFMQKTTPAAASLV